jgi:uncharacterized protein with FMN-binding domain
MNKWTSELGEDATFGRKRVKVEVKEDEIDYLELLDLLKDESE